MSAGALTRQRWRTFLRPRHSEQGAAGAILGVVCVAASVGVFFGDYTGGAGSTVGSLAALPVLLAAWFLSRRWTLGVTVLALTLRVLALALGDVTAVTFLAQAIVLVVVAPAVSIASSSRSAETAVAAALAEAEAASRAKSEYLSRVSHELRTPLTVIVGFAGLLEMENPRPDQESSIAMVLQGGDQLLRMIDDLLEISRVESGREEVSLTAVRVDEVIAESVALVALSASQRRVAVHHDLESSAGQWVRGDAQRLRQVMLNLLTNAIKYNREGGHVDISVRSTGGDRLRLTVRDSGPGIARVLLPRLFQPFDRLGAERTTVTGTGLGLALSKRLVETMEGTIGVDTEPGKGAAFWVELARATEVEEEAADAKTTTAVPTVAVVPSGAQRGAPAAKTALYVEDNLANLELVQRTLEHRPAVRLLPLMQGGLALDLAVQQCPDLILLDVHLPDINGDEVLRRLKSDDRTRDIPVIMLSADATPNQASRFRRAGAGAYLTKPIRVRELLSAIDDALAGDRSPS